MVVVVLIVCFMVIYCGILCIEVKVFGFVDKICFVNIRFLMLVGRSDWNGIV